MSRRVSALVAGLIAVLLWPAAPAAAHPLGNLSTNQYVGLTVRPDRVEALAVLDLAELPTLRGDAPGCAEFASAITLRVDGTAVGWEVAPRGFEYRPGDGGLRTSRLTCSLSAPVRAVSQIEIINGYAPERVGWHELTAIAVDGVRLVDPPVPAASASDVLRSYPVDPLAASPSVRSAVLRVQPGSAAPISAVVPAGAGPLGEWAAAAEAAFQRLAAGRLTPVVGVLAVLLALALGAGHAALPGHGKLVMAGYALGSGALWADGGSASRAGGRAASGGTGVRARWARLRAGRARRWRDGGAVVLAVTASHTGAVLVVGLLLSATSLVGERVLGFLGVVSGMIVVAVGIGMFRNRLGGHHHGPDGHPHGPGGHGLDLGRHLHESDGPDGHPPNTGGHWHGPDQHTPNLSGQVDGSEGRTPNLGGHVDGPDGRMTNNGRHWHGSDGRAHQAGGPGKSHGDAEERPADHRAGVGGLAVLAGPPVAAPAGAHHHHHHGAAGGRGALGPAGIGLAGGLVPSPSAVVVLLGAIGLGRTAFGVLLVVAYGVGMAATLTMVGLALAAVRRRLGRLPRLPRAVRWLPRLAPRGTAVLVMIVGLGMAARAAAMV
ncbi:hypothetical protein [Catenuloplanes atrovinosus]|uniref:ABC-type nickel/cobalt efflux system permease component RcnA n=1 Tax=Catenuloplanes atrovinosus TaxID=137266 RepID=A0AAE3YLM6_9ACTN|nr:hypothetical protein [Catenuloplanes atrovinosus]MDR7276083.1 ABC-type nickel/cobalt efflux system permease component RcnA [Catenuloplanes atrovinosus]